ncbi:hypothetical protein [Tumebacillus sp. BK434]|uniref:hypothetical protein n=1 Tax=Tumebacillus sp. BK434 TaxID=2512169 RepID=UPI0010514514|nr:hypothetical protein [Tumebacillus sp. BK434]
MDYLRYFLVGTSFGVLLFLMALFLVIVMDYQPKYDLTLYFGVGFLGGVITNAAVAITKELRKTR